MDRDDTVIGGPQQDFPSTHWSLVLRAGQKGNPQQQAALGDLIQTYWKPVFAYIRAAWRKTVEDAKDLTQAFFARVLEKEYVERLHPDQGSFRGYLKRALKHFLIDAHRSEEVRRPQGQLFSFEASREDLEKIGPTTPEETPDSAFDREWMRAMFRSALEAFRDELVREGKAKYFEVFRLYCLRLSEGSEPTMDEPGG
jgi:RNA polymerase sigma-70 factor (ECF subfamily)